MISGQLRYSLLNVPPEVTPLKFRGWFREEAKNIQALAKGPHDFIIVRLFITERLRIGVTQRKLDSIFQDAVDRFSNIHRIEIEGVDAPLTADEMMQAGVQANQDLAELAKRMVETVDKKPPTLH